MSQSRETSPEPQRPAELIFHEKVINHPEFAFSLLERVRAIVQEQLDMTVELQSADGQREVCSSFLFNENIISVEIAGQGRFSMFAELLAEDIANDLVREFEHKERKGHRFLIDPDVEVCYQVECDEAADLAIVLRFKVATAPEPKNRLV